MFLYELENVFLFCQEVIGDSDLDFIPSVIAIGRILIFTILILSVQNYGRQFHILVFSSISFFRVLKISLWGQERIIFISVGHKSDRKWKLKPVLCFAYLVKTGALDQRYTQQEVA